MLNLSPVLSIRFLMLRRVFPGLLLTSLLSSCTLIQSQLELISSDTSSSKSVSPDTSLSKSVSPEANPAEIAPAETTPVPQQEAQSPQSDPYLDAIKKASSALILSESAQSKDDWQLVVGRWQQAIALLQAVPSSSPDYGKVTSRLTDYRRNLKLAQQKSAQPLSDGIQTGSAIVISSSNSPNNPNHSDSLNRPDNNTAPALAPNVVPSSNGAISSTSSTVSGQPLDQFEQTEQNTGQNSKRRYEAPIVRRSGGTPIVHALFNGRYTVEMIVDTGASGTVLTQPVARSLGIRPTGQTRVSTASDQNVTFSLGEVDSIEVSGVKLDNATVAIAGPNLNTGLLGHDFFGRYDVTIREDVVEFRER